MRGLLSPASPTNDIVARLAAILKRQNLSADDVFFRIDANKDNRVSYTELTALLLELDPTLTRQQCVDAFNKFDQDGNGSVDLAEFRKAIHDVGLPAANLPRFLYQAKPNPERLVREEFVQKAREVFRQFDRDQNGYIDYSELTAMLRTLDPTRWTPQRTVQLLRDVDVDQDERIHFDEFLSWAAGEHTDSRRLLGAASSAERELDAVTQNALHFANRGLWTDVLQLLDAHRDAFVNVVVGGRALLHHAAEQGRTDVVAVLIDSHSAGPTVLTGDGKAAAALALERGFRDTADFIIVSVAKVLIRWASEERWDFIMDALGTNPRAVNVLPEGYPHRLLHYAASQGRKEIIGTLVKNFGADPTLEGSDGRKPVDLAMQHQHVHVIDQLSAAPHPPASPLARLLAAGARAPLRAEGAVQDVAAQPGNAPSISGLGGGPIDGTVARFLGMSYEPRWGHGDTDGEESGDEGGGRNRGFLDDFGRGPTNMAKALNEQALQQIASMRLSGNLNGWRFGTGPIGVIADINYGQLRPVRRTTTAPKHYDLTLSTFQRSMDTFNQQQCIALLLLGDQIDKRDRSGADLAASSVLAEASGFHHPEHVGWLLGYHDTKYSRFFQAQRAGAGTAVLGSFCYEFTKVGEDGSSWSFIALDAYSAVCSTGHEQRRRNGHAGVTIEARSRLHGAIGPEQLQWLDRRLAACQRKGDNVVLLSHSPLHCRKFMGWPPDRSAVGIIAHVQNSQEVLHVVRRYVCVKLILSGHDHRGGHYQDSHGVHHVSIPACVSADRAGLSGALLWCFANHVLLDYLVAPGRTCSRVQLTLG